MEARDNEEYEAVLAVKNIVEANLMEELLKAEDIRYFVREWRDVNYDGALDIDKGWGWILGRKEDEERIRTIYADCIRNSGEEVID